MKNTKSSFIITSDKKTAEKLLSYGCEQIPTSNGTYTFLNCQLNFAQTDIDTKKITYSNILCI